MKKWERRRRRPPRKKRAEYLISFILIEALLIFLLLLFSWPYSFPFLFSSFPDPLYLFRTFQCIITRLSSLPKLPIYWEIPFTGNQHFSKQRCNSPSFSFLSFSAWPLSSLFQLVMVSSKAYQLVAQPITVSFFENLIIPLPASRARRDAVSEKRQTKSRSGYIRFGKRRVDPNAELLYLDQLLLWISMSTSPSTPAQTLSTSSSYFPANRNPRHQRRFLSLRLI